MHMSSVNPATPATGRGEERPGADLGPGFERSLHPMLVVDSVRRYVDANAAASLFMRMPREEIIRHRVDEFVPPEGLADFDNSWRAFISRGSAPAESEWYFPADETRIPIVVGCTSIGSDLHLIVVLPWGSPEEAETALVDDARTGDGSALTKRERQMLTLLALGHSGEQIAQELFISPETVRTHVQHARSKLGASTRTHAIAIALTRGEISPVLTDLGGRRPADSREST